jgi:hypothetical protein
MDFGRLVKSIRRNGAALLPEANSPTGGRKGFEFFFSKVVRKFKVEVIGLVENNDSLLCGQAYSEISRIRGYADSNAYINGAVL